MKLSVLRTIPGKYSGRDHNGDIYYTDDEEVICEYEYDMETFIYFCEEKGIDYKPYQDDMEELVHEHEDEFARWLDKERGE